jgi:group I intron endonuclease
MRLKTGIYKIENIVSKKIYVGQSIDLQNRKNLHFYWLRKNNHANTHLQSSFKKYGEENFKFSILLYCEDFELTRYETFYDNYYKALGLSYNARKCIDSNKGIKHSAEAIQKMSDSHKGKPSGRKGIPISEKQKELLSKMRKGIKLSDGHKKKISESMKISHPAGSKVSEETKMKISEGNKKSWKRRKGVE